MNPANRKRVKKAFFICSYHDLENERTCIIDAVEEANIGEKYKVILASDPLAIGTGESLLQGIIRNIEEECDVVICLLDGLRLNIAFELGIAFGLNKPTILLIEKGAWEEFKKSFSDLGGIKVIIYEGKNFLSPIPGLIKKELERIKNQEIKLRLTPEQLLAKGDAFFSTGDYEGAVEAYDAALAQKRKFYSALVRKGDALYEMDKVPEAVESYLIAIQEWPDKGSAYEGLGRAYEYLGKYREAGRDCYEPLIKLQPNNPHFYGKVALAFFFSSDFLGGIEWLDNKIKEQPHLKGFLSREKAWLYTSLAEFYPPRYKRKYCLKAIESLKECLKTSPPEMKDLIKGDEDYDILRKMPEFQALFTERRHPHA